MGRWTEWTDRLFVVPALLEGEVSDLRNISKIELDIAGDAGYIEVQTYEHKGRRMTSRPGGCTHPCGPHPGSEQQTLKTSHGLKATTLSWLWKANCSARTCLILGLGGGRKTSASYGRDIQAGPL